MARKKIDDTPPGGWLGPGMADENGDRGPREAIGYAVKWNPRKGAWKMKAIDAAYLRACEKRRREIMVRSIKPVSSPA